MLVSPSLNEKTASGEDNWTVSEIKRFIEFQKSKGTRPEKQIIAIICAGCSHEDIPDCMKQLSSSWDWVDCSKYSWKCLLPLGERENLDDAIFKITASIFDISNHDLEIHAGTIKRERKKLLQQSAFGLFVLVAILLGLTAWALVERKKSLELEMRAKIDESNALANHSYDATKQNRSGLGAALALKALPGRISSTRPYVWRAGVALGLAYQELRQFELLQFQRPMRGVVWNEKQNKIYAVSIDGDIFIQSPTDSAPYRPIKSLHLDAEKVNDGKDHKVVNVVQGAEPGALIILDDRYRLTVFSESSNDLKEISTTIKNVDCITRSASGNSLIISSQSGFVEILDSRSLESKHVLSVGKHLAPWCAQVDERNDLVLVAGSSPNVDKGMFAVFDEKGNLLASESYPNEGFMTHIDINAEINLVSLVSIEGHVLSYILTEVEHGKFIPKINEQIKGQAFFNTVFSPDGSLMLVGDNKGALYLYEVETSSRLDEIYENTSMVFSISPGQHAFATASDDGTVRLLKYRSEAAPTRFSGQKGIEASTSISRDGKLIALGTMQGWLTLRHWTFVFHSHLTSSGMWKRYPYSSRPPLTHSAHFSIELSRARESMG